MYFAINKILQSVEQIITISSKNKSVKKLNTNWDVMAGMTQKRAILPNMKI